MSARDLPSAAEVRELLLDALRGATSGGGLAAAYDDKAQANDYFEAFLLLTLMEEAQAAKWTTTIVDPSGVDQPDLLLRAAPGSFVRPTQPYTHLLLSRRGAFDLEAHVGVKIRGYSNVLHEADLLLLPRAVGEACRSDGTPPTVGQATALLEAKFISAATVPLGYGRGLLGLDHDMTQLPNAALVSTRPGPSVDDLLDAWGLRHIGGVLASPGVINDRELREHFRELLDWWAQSGRWWRPSVQFRRRRGSSAKP